MTDYIVVGLGNPGLKYSDSRHNIGAACIAQLARQYETKLRSNSLALYGNVRMGDSDVLLVRPRTWYNGTGQAVQHLMERNPIPVERLIVIYDEVELAEGVVDLRLYTGDVGNNGLRSIIDTIENPDFGLIRIGVGGPLGMRRSLFDPNMILRHVLSQPGPETRTLLDKAIDRGCEAVEAIVMEGWDHAVDEWEAVRIEKS